MKPRTKIIWGLIALGGSIVSGAIASAFLQAGQEELKEEAYKEAKEL